jgi:parvulin-like peptidyl-prolyl isomerase
MCDPPQARCNSAWHIQMKMMKLVYSASLAVALIALTLGAAHARAQAASIDSTAASDAVVARGNGFEIKQSEMDRVLATARANDPVGKLPSDAPLHVLAQLIEIHLVLQKATDAEKAEGSKFADQRLASIMKTLGSAEFERRLKTTEMTEDNLRIALFQEQTAQASLTRQLGINVTDADVKKYFDAHPGSFDQPQMARVRELLLLTTAGYSSDPLPAATVQARRQQIADLYKRISGGEDFAVLAKQYNQDPISIGTGGVFSFRRTQMEFGDLAFSMKPNQISDVLVNSDGFRVFQLLEIIPPKKADFATLAPQLKTALEGAERRRRGPAYIAQLRKQADIEILDPDLKAKVAAADAQAAQLAQAQEQAGSASQPANAPPASRQ